MQAASASVAARKSGTLGNHGGHGDSATRFTGVPPRPRVHKKTYPTMPDETPAKPFREKIVEAIAAEGGILNPRDFLQTVSDKMVALDSNMLPVSEDGLLVGMADQANPAREASAHGHDPKTTRISDTMNRDMVYCHEEDECADALHKMVERKLSRIVGLVAREDLISRIGKAETNQTAVGPVGVNQGASQGSSPGG